MLQYLDGASGVSMCRYVVLSATSSQESGVVYLVRLSNEQRVRVHVFVVHDIPEVPALSSVTFRMRTHNQL